MRLGEKYEFVIPLTLFILFIAFTLPGIAWGAPNIWHPDEIVVRSIKALHGEWKFDEINFDYPSLPQYVMFGFGKLILAMGYTDLEVLIASRVLSAILAGLTIVLTYIITRRISNNIYVAGFQRWFYQYIGRRKIRLLVTAVASALPAKETGMPFIITRQFLCKNRKS